VSCDIFDPELFRLLLQDKGLVKTIQFENPRYIGDPINAVRIFNDKEADELILLDIQVSREHGLLGRLKKNTIPFTMIEKISHECLMPLTYGGGVGSLSDIGALFNAGVEKVAINTHAVYNPGLITEASDTFGRQSILVSIDVRKNAAGDMRSIRTAAKNLQDSIQQTCQKHGVVGCR
jgi:cyclase